MTHRTRLSSLLVASTFAALTLLGACGTTTRFVATNPSPHPLVAKPASAVHVYTTGVPEVPYVEVGILPTGQVVGLIDEMPTVAELLERIMDQADGALSRLCGPSPGPSI